METNFFLKEVRCFYLAYGHIYSSSVGCLVKDLNKKKYYDLAGMGVTSCILGSQTRTLIKQLLMV